MTTTYRNMTIEHLGQIADERDLRDFRDACERILPAFEGDEATATDFVWNNGRILFEADICAYCQQLISDRSYVPRADDDEAWTRLAEMHADDCEWIATRAHRAFA